MLVKVSVIIPNYNHAPYLKERIESVLNQTYHDFEVIILDDCSTDDSRDIIEQYRNQPKVSKIVYNETNSGSTFKQWQKGIELAQGEWIWIAESDDWCEPTLLNELISGLDINDVISFCGTARITGNDLFIMSQPFFKRRLSGIDFIKDKMIFGNSITNASMAIFNKKAVNSINKDFVNYKFCGDWLFWCEIAFHGNIVYTGKVLNYFRKHDSDISTKAMANGTFYIEYLNMLQYFLSKNIITRKESFETIFNTTSRIRSIDGSNELIRSYWDKLPISYKIWKFFSVTYYRLKSIHKAIGKLLMSYRNS